MSGRAAIMNRVRAALGASGDGAARRAAVEKRLRQAPEGVIPARGQLDPQARAELFCAMAEKVAASVERVKSDRDVPAAVTAWR